MSANQDYQIEKWRHLIKEYQESGMRLIDWCADNGVSKDQYYYWLNKIRSKYYDVAVNQLQTTGTRSSVSIKPEGKSGEFVEIKPGVVNEVIKQAGLPAAVLQKGNIRIEIMPSASASFIRQLLTAVQYA
jgi:hypothetical protein